MNLSQFSNRIEDTGSTQIKFDSVSFAYLSDHEKETVVLSDFNNIFQVNRINVLFGPNGCGKTTILRLLAGMEKPNRGGIIYPSSDGRQRRISYVFQNYKDTLLPWLTVRRNLSILENNLLRVDRLLDKFGLYHFKDSYPYELSGGQQQILAIVKAIAYSSDIMLLDEPFSALDFNRARKFWQIFTNIWETEGTTAFLVSHSIEEAIFLGEHLHIMSKIPTRVIERIDLVFPKPQGLHWFASDEYFNVRRHIEDILETPK